MSSDLGPYLQQFICEAEPVKKIGRPRTDPDRVATNVERARKAKSAKKNERHSRIAILDMETDPFDSKTKKKIFPFLAVLYSDDFEPVIIWDEHFPAFTAKLVKAIEALPGEYTIYAHNGGRFDFMFLIHKMRGEISFKGRGIMDARIGRHHLRDSFHLIPERLAAYQKDVFDYKKLYKNKRRNHRDEIIQYCINDCKYLLDLVKKFVADFGLKMSIGQAAMCEIKKHYEVEKFTDGWDNFVRQYFFGGRVECIRGRGNFEGPFKLVDVNAMYPDVMANKRHPIGGFGDYKLRAGIPSNDTVFIDLTCRNNGALVGRTECGETSARIAHGRFHTTIWEYEVALKHNLISDVHIHYSLDCAKRSDFSMFVIPLYEKRLVLKEFMQQLKSEGKQLTQAFVEAKKDDMFYKFLLNNGYGKFAQNPRRFKEHYITDSNELPPDVWFASMKHMRPEERAAHCLPEFESDLYWIWSKPAPSFTFNNVGTAASITGAARAKLLDALQMVRDPIYCDTDSIICRDTGRLELDKSKLGAWDLEDEFKRVVITGKKLYAVEHMKPKARSAEDLERGLSPDYTVKSKGTSGLNWRDMLTMLAGETIEKTNWAPTLTRRGDQDYMTRRIQATAPLFSKG